ncbi:hypothetical protein SCANM63S_00684 [Streptomyces canarius]
MPSSEGLYQEPCTGTWGTGLIVTAARKPCQNLRPGSGATSVTPSLSVTTTQLAVAGVGSRRGRTPCHAYQVPSAGLLRAGARTPDRLGEHTHGPHLGAAHCHASGSRLDPRTAPSRSIARRAGCRQGQPWRRGSAHVPAVEGSAGQRFHPCHGPPLVLPAVGRQAEFQLPVRPRHLGLRQPRAVRWKVQTSSTHDGTAPVVRYAVPPPAVRAAARRTGPRALETWLGHERGARVERPAGRPDVPRPVCARPAPGLPGTATRSRSR